MSTVDRYGQGRGGRPWRRMRDMVMKRDKGLCQACRREGRYSEASEVDHVVCLAEGGTDEASNLEAICDSCHAVKTQAEQQRGKARAKGGEQPEAPEPKVTGRPPHKPGDVDREQVSTLAGGGMPHWQIAMVMGMSRATLEKHYEEELSYGAAVSRAEVLQAMKEAALKGNVSAAKYYLANEPELAAPPLAGEEPPEEPSVPEPQVAKLGKKAQADRDAQTAAQGTEWEELLEGGGKVVALRR